MHDGEIAESKELLTEDQLLSAVRQIAEALSVVESGELPEAIELPFASSEPIAALAACVNMMARSLSDRREETLAYQRELEGQIATIEKQRAAISELSTPIIELWNGVLCVPIVGVLDSARASEMTSSLLSSIVDKKARFIIIDITGIDAMDTSATDHFLRMARAVRLLGAECVLSGVNPNVARTITHMGIDLGNIQAHRTLREALQRYVRNLRAHSRAKNQNRQPEPRSQEHVPATFAKCRD